MMIIPMAGLSARFARAGYAVPKFMLPVGSRTVFDFAIAGFLNRETRRDFLFIHRGGAETAEFIRSRARALDLAAFRVVELDEPTEGQAETVERGLDAAGVAPETGIDIFNIDTFYLQTGPCRPDCDGYLDVFEGGGENWSFVRPGNDDLVLETAEKDPISNLCCTGLYHFARVGDFRDALARERRIDRPARELYVAPLYNHLIRLGRHIRYRLLNRSDIVFSGVPAEYEAIRADAPLVTRLETILNDHLAGRP